MAVAAGVYHNVALRDDGSIATGAPAAPVRCRHRAPGIQPLPPAVDHSLALRDDGSIASWGRDTYGEVSQTPNGTGFTAIADSITHSLALRDDGSIVSWGDDTYGQVSQTPNGTGFTAIAAGGYHSLALVAPVAPAIGLEANVSVDGGATWLAADTAPGPYLPNGTPPRFRFTATNTGNVALSNITVTDSMLGPITLSATTLQPGASATNVTIGTWAAGAYAATATASATYQTQTVTASDPAHYVGAERPVAGLHGERDPGNGTVDVAFTDTSTDAPTTWTWTFGDGARSTATAPELRLPPPATTP